MPLPVSVLDPLSQHHVAAALTVNGNGSLSQGPETALKTMRRRQRCGMELRIAAGQPYRIRARIRRLVGERREGENLGAGFTPAIEQMRIEKGEGAIVRDRNALARWRQTWPCDRG